ncbi:MAG: GFA family protein [Hyphomonadaceae bacterium]
MSGEGRCLCGNISYVFEGEPVVTVVCHCTNCQRQSGAAFSVNLLASEAQITISGDLTVFEDRSDAGEAVLRKFCGRCGSPILSALGSMPGMVALKAGTLDDVSKVEPGLQVFCDSKQGWLTLDGLAAFAKSPPS